MSNIIDYSQLNTFLKCQKSYYNKYILGLSKISYDDRDIDMEFGRYVHTGLALHYRGNDIGTVLDTFNTFKDLEGNKVKTRVNGIQVLREYIERYRNEDKDIEVLGVEVKDTFNIGGVEFTVKLDRIVKERGNIYALDTKTTGNKYKNNFFTKFNLDMQVSAYCRYVEIKYGQCSGFIPDAVFLGHRERKWKGLPAGFHVEFERVVVNRYKQQLEDFEKNVLGVVKNLEWCRENDVWCKVEGNCGRCAYKELCMSVDDGEIKDTLYEVKNPLSYLQKEE